MHNFTFFMVNKVACFHVIALQNISDKKIRKKLDPTKIGI